MELQLAGLVLVSAQACLVCCVNDHSDMGLLSWELQYASRWQHGFEGFGRTSLGLRTILVYVNRLQSVESGRRCLGVQATSVDDAASMSELVQQEGRTHRKTACEHPVS